MSEEEFIDQPETGEFYDIADVSEDPLMAAVEEDVAEREEKRGKQRGKAAKLKALYREIERKNRKAQEEYRPIEQIMEIPREEVEELSKRQISRGRKCYKYMKKNYGIDCGSDCDYDEVNEQIEDLIRKEQQKDVPDKDIIANLKICKKTLVTKKMMWKIERSEKEEFDIGKKAFEAEEPQKVKKAKGPKIIADSHLVNFIVKRLYLQCAELDLENRIVTSIPRDYRKKTREYADKWGISISGTGISALWKYVSFLTFWLLVNIGDDKNKNIKEVIEQIKGGVTKNDDICKRKLPFYPTEEKQSNVADLDLNCARIALMNILHRLKMLQADGYIERPFLSKQDFKTALNIIVPELIDIPEFEKTDEQEEQVVLLVPIVRSDLAILYTESTAQKFAEMAADTILVLNEAQKSNNKTRNRIRFFAA